MEGRSSTADRGRCQTVAQSQSGGVSGLSQVCAGGKEGVGKERMESVDVQECVWRRR